MPYSFRWQKWPKWGTPGTANGALCLKFEWGVTMGYIAHLLTSQPLPELSLTKEEQNGGQLQQVNSFRNAFCGQNPTPLRAPEIRGGGVYYRQPCASHHQGEIRNNITHHGLGMRPDCHQQPVTMTTPTHPPVAIFR